MQATFASTEVFKELKNFSTNADRTLVSTDEVALVTCAGGIRTITLPSAVNISGKMLWVKKTDSSVNRVKVKSVLGQTIDGSLTYNLFGQYHAVCVMSDNANWHIIASHL